MKTVYFVRHGETLFNQQRRLQGWRDSPLSDRGVEQVRRVARALKRLEIHEALISPLGRARQTAAIICEELGICSFETPDLREVSFGDFEGNTLEELDIRFPGMWAARTADKWNFRPPGGEANRDAVPRARAVVKKIEEMPSDRILLVVAHFAINRIVLSRLAGIEPEETIIMNIPHEVIYRAQGGNSNWEISHLDVRENHQDFQPGWLTEKLKLPTGG
ncbi:MAG: histidine phosphatase family protein [bacterium]|jgi:broad specificity phosphatase PhoE